MTRAALAALVVMVTGLLPAKAGALSARTAVKRVFGHATDARCIAKHESGFGPRKVSPTSDYGLFQINGPTWFGHAVRYRGRVKYVTRRWIFNPLYNAKVAWIISRGGSDWSPWTTAGSCGL